MTLKSGLAAAALAAATTLALPAHATERIIFNCFFPPQNYVCTEWLPEMKRRIEEVTDERVKVNIPPKSLAGPPDQYDGVVGGVMDGALQFNFFIANVAPGVQFSLLPFTGGAKSEAVAPALWDTYQKFFADKDEYTGVQLLALVTTSGSETWSMTETPILTAADIGNRKMWALPGIVADTIKPTGSSVVAGPAVQMLEIISKGVVDGYIGVPFTSLQAFKLIDYTKSGTITEGKLFMPSFSFMVSREKWDKISPEDQAAIMNVMGADFAQWTGKSQDGHNAAARKAVEDAGIELIEGAPELETALREYGQPAIDAWVEQMKGIGVDGQAVLDFYAAEIARRTAELGGS